MSNKIILDACCGSRMFWFDKENKNVLFADIRKEEHTLCDGRSLTISPDILSDFTKMEFADSSFKLVVFDPPHMDNINPNAYMAQKYGTLRRGKWQEDIKKGFDECMRVLEPYGVLIFKWNETRVTVRRILAIIEAEPLFGHKSRKASKTHWLCFMKIPNNVNTSDVEVDKIKNNNKMNTDTIICRQCGTEVYAPSGCSICPFCGCKTCGE